MLRADGEGVAKEIDRMILRQFLHTEPVAASYLFGCGGKSAGAVVDPVGDIAPYLASAEASGMRILYVIDTHVHADHVSSGRALAEAAVAATVLLGVNQGLCWSMTQTAKLDITRPDERGLTIGLNEFSGYVGVALAGILTAYAATALGPRVGLLVFGLAVVLAGLVLTLVWVRDTLPWAHAEAARHARAAPGALRPPYPEGVAANPTIGEVFALMSWRDRRLAAISQAGLVEKFVDALVWVILPVFLYQRGVNLPDIGWIVGVYGLVWGGSQLFTGRLSDHVGRHWPNVLGMWICGAGVALFLLGDGVLWWSFAAVVAGFGMALLYPNLSAAVADISPPAWRGSAIGIYRFWRDLGYAIGGLGLGLAAQLAGGLDAAFWFVAVSMFLSGALLLRWGEETHPRLNPAPIAEA